MSHYDKEFGQSFGDTIVGEEAMTRLKWFNATKGFGFVSPLDGSVDAFLHVSVLHRAGLQEVKEQAKLLCEIGKGPKGPQVLRIIEVLSEGLPSSIAPFAQATGGVLDGYHDPDGGRASYAEDKRANGPEIELDGTVKWFKADKGFGFITIDSSDKDVFIHKTVLQRSGFFTLEAGQRVRMRIKEVEKGREATWISFG